MEEGRSLRDARRLLHVMGDEDDRVAAAKLVDQFLDPRRGDRVERRAGLVHQDHLGIDRNGAGDAKALLLAAGKRGAAFREAILHLVPQAGPLQRALDDRVELCLVCGEAVNARPVGDIFVDRLGDGVGLLEHHADAGAELHHVHVGAVYVLAVEGDGALDPRRRDRIVHPVERAKKGGLAAARRADEGRDVLPGDVDRHIVDRSLVAVEDGDVAGRHFRHLGIGLVHQRFSNLLRR